MESPTAVKSDLPDLLVFLNIEDDIKKLTDNLKSCIEFFGLYDLDSVDDQFLRHVMPTIRRTLKKIYEDNILLTDTSGGEFLQDILKDNLQIAMDLMSMTKQIVQCILSYESVPFNRIPNVPLNLGNCLIETFQHCERHALYPADIKTDLILLFNIAQETHLSFLKLLESCPTFEYYDSKLETFSLFCEMGELLSHINVKSLINNWKTLINIFQKHLDIFNDPGFLKVPFKYITTDIAGHLERIFKEKDKSDGEVVPVIKIVGFLVKVALKLLSVFSSMVNNAMDELTYLCFTIYCVNLNSMKSFGFSEYVINLLESTVIKPTSTIFQHFFATEQFYKKLANASYLHGNKSLFFWDNITKIILETVSSFSTDCILFLFNTICCSIKKLQLMNEDITTSISDLIINTSCLIILKQEDYSYFEEILLQNICQDNFWLASFTTEVYFTTLSCTNNCLTQTDINSLLKKCNNTYFSCQPQNIFLLNLIERLNEQCKFESKYTSNSTEILESKLDAVCNFDENSDLLEILPVVNSLMYDLSSYDNNKPSIVQKTTVCIDKLWSIQLEYNSSNELLRCFLLMLIKCTSFVYNSMDIHYKQSILKHLSQLSMDNKYIVAICEFFSYVNQSRETEISMALNNLIPSLEKCKNILIQQYLLEILYGNIKFTRTCYIHFTETPEKSIYYVLLSKIKFTHECIDWNNVGEIEQKPKKVKGENFKSYENIVGHIDGDCDLSEVISRMKSDVKCFSKLFQSDKLSKRDKNDLRYIINQLSSFV